MEKLLIGFLVFFLLIMIGAIAVIMVEGGTLVMAVLVICGTNGALISGLSLLLVREFGKESIEINSWHL